MSGKTRGRSIMNEGDLSTAMVELLEAGGISFWRNAGQARAALHKLVQASLVRAGVPPEWPEQSQPEAPRDQ